MYKLAKKLLLKTLLKIWHTVSHLKAIQVFYQIKYRLLKTKSLSKFNHNAVKSVKLHFFKIPKPYVSLIIRDQQYTFTFLNVTQDFRGTINWNFEEHGRLWNYNLQYLDCLKQSNLNTLDKSKIIIDIYLHLQQGKLKPEPYPASLRIMNVIRFLNTHEAIPQKNSIQDHLMAEIDYLNQHLEYHILANHLLENIMAIMMGAYYFNLKKLKQKAHQLLTKELQEQILADGAHYELTPMYHNIILFRLLECLNYIPKEYQLYQLLLQKCAQMLSFMNAMAFKNGFYPHFNDSTEGIAYSVKDLNAIAEELAIPKLNLNLKESAYRSFENEAFEIKMNACNISPSYQPGHAHADTFTFCLNYKNEPIIVDTGISTYNDGERRSLERSTAAHNTLNVNHQNSSKVWSAFRVAQRAKVKIIKEKENFLSAQHDGYQNKNIIHQRNFALSEETFLIEDYVKNIKNNTIRGTIHFHPSIQLKQLDGFNIEINGLLLLTFNGIQQLKIKEYKFCKGYNQLMDALCVSYVCKREKCAIFIKEIDKSD